MTDHLVNLQEEHVDLAVRIGELSDSGLVARRLGAVRRVVCGSPSYFSKRGKPKAPRDLSQHDCITSTFGGVASPQVWVFAAGKTKAAVTVHSRLVANAELSCRGSRCRIRDHTGFVVSPYRAHSE